MYYSKGLSQMSFLIVKFKISSLRMTAWVPSYKAGLMYKATFRPRLQATGVRVRSEPPLANR